MVEYHVTAELVSSRALSKQYSHCNEYQYNIRVDNSNHTVAGHSQAGVRSARRFKELMISGTTVRNKRHGAEDSSGQDRMGGYTRWPEAYLVTLTDRCSFLCVSGQRGTIAKSMHEEHLCVVALTSMERGTQFFPLASYRLV